MTRSKILEKKLNILIGLKFVKLVLSFPLPLGVVIFAGTNFREFRDFCPEFAKISSREIFLI